MRQVWITRHGGPEVLEVREAPDPMPGPGEARIRVEAAGINFADVSARVGTYPDAPPPPCVVGYEVAGAIDAVGPGVPESRLGEAVVGLTRFGGYADAVVVPAAQAIARPTGLAAPDAAGLPVTYLTAYQMLFEAARVRPGDRVLIHQAAGGVGLAAIDLCRIAGARTFGSCSAAKHDFVRGRGLEHPIDYRTRDWEVEVRDLVGRGGIDIILDPVGGDSWRRGLRLLAPNGRLVCFGLSASTTGPRRSIAQVARTLAAVPWLQVNPISLMNGNRGISGVNLGRMWDEVDRLSGWFERILGWWAEGRVRPHVDRVFPFARAGDAHAWIQERRNVGKVLLVPD